MPMSDRDEREILQEHDRSIRDNKHDLNNLRQVIDIKLTQITKDVGDLRNALKWAGGLIISLMISFMGWALLQQYNANETAKTQMQQRLEELQRQRSSTPSAAQPSLAPVRVGQFKNLPHVRPQYRSRNQLGYPITTADFKWLWSNVRQNDHDFAPIVRVNRPRPIGDEYAVLRR